MATPSRTDAMRPAWHAAPLSEWFPSPAKLKRTYEDLMWGYNLALSKAAQPSRKKNLSLVSPKRWSDDWLTRLMVGSHIRHHLSELRDGYIALLTTASAAADRDWLNQVIEDAGRLIETLPEIRPRAILLALVAPVVAVLSKITGSPTWLVAVLVFFGGVSPTVVFIGYFSLRDSYLVKRQLLFPNAPVADRLKANEQRAASEGLNVYELENAAFSAMRRGKRLEFEVDRLVIDAAVGMVALACFFAPFLLMEDDLWDPFFIAFVALGLFDLIWRTARRKRVWR
jgi:hypothetical protein